MAPIQEDENSAQIQETIKRQIRDSIRRDIEDYRLQQGQMDEDQRQQRRTHVSENIKREVRSENMAANTIGVLIDSNNGTVTSEISHPAQSVLNAVELFVAAAEADLIEKPTHPPTRQVFDMLVARLSAQGINVVDAQFLHPIINGLINHPNYIALSEEGQPATQFEKDLEKIVSAQGQSKAETHLEEIVSSAGASIGFTIDKLNSKKTLAKANRAAFVQRANQERATALRGMSGRDIDAELIRVIKEGQERDPQVLEAEKFIEHLDSTEKFMRYYNEKFEEALREVVLEGTITDSEKRNEKAAKKVAEQMHKLILFITDKIYTLVIDSSGHEPWQALIAKTSRTPYLTADTFFVALTSKIHALSSSVSESDPRGREIPLYTYGNKTTKAWEALRSDQADPKTGKTVTIGGKMVSYSAPSNELERTHSLNEFLHHLHLTAHTEKDLLEAGVNSHYLMRSGKTEQNMTFFQQLSGYAQSVLEANRLDELYKLPFAEIVEAAKIHLSGYYKKKLAGGGWIKSPEILQGLFSNVDEAEKEALKDMVVNYKGIGVPDWAIKRAIIHARTHISLVNLEMHALSSYGDAPVTELGKASYKDPGMKNLDVFQTWYAGQQWQVSDMFLKGMAFLPRPDQSWRMDDWFHEDIQAEGEDIYAQAFRLGKLARYGRTTYTKDMDPNIFERNPMGYGGLETQRGWRMKYSLMPWLRNLADNFNDPNELNVDGKDRGLEHAWKRIENIGITPMQVLVEELLISDNLLKHTSEKKAKYETQYRHLFRYLYDRYFKSGVGKESFSFTFYDKDYREQTVKYSDIQSADEFWSDVVEPILNRPVMSALGLDPKAAAKRNSEERSEELKHIMDQALTVMAFERSPMDFVFVENPSKSQNGVTFLEELKKHFQKDFAAIVALPAERKDNMLDEAFDDILYVQQRARIVTATQMNGFVSKQNDEAADHQKTVFGENLASLDEDRSRLYIVEQQRATGSTGYAIDETVVRALLEEKYKVNEVGIPAEESQNRRLKVEAACELYRQVVSKVKLKPAVNDHEENPELTATRKKMEAKALGIDLDKLDAAGTKKFEDDLKAKLKLEFERARDEDMVSRLAWSMNELIASKTVALPINDTAYQFLEFVRAGKDMVQRTVYAVAATQEKYRDTVIGGELLSALKKYYRGEDQKPLNETISKMRDSIKTEDLEKAEDATMRVTENSINVMRINSDAENIVVDTQYQLDHRKRAAMSGVVYEGPQYPLRREDRYHLLNDIMHVALFPKRVKPEDQVWEYENAWTAQDVLGNLGEFGEKVGSIADKIFGRQAGRVVRKRWKEKSAEGLRDREFANIISMLTREGPKYLIAIFVAIMILGMVKGYQEAEKMG